MRELLIKSIRLLEDLIEETKQYNQKNTINPIDIGTMIVDINVIKKAIEYLDVGKNEEAIQILEARGKVILNQMEDQMED